jgi:hypothetical protein
MTSSRLTVPDVLPMVREYVAKPGNMGGGSLHMVLDDGNWDDGSVRFCINWAAERGDVEGFDLGLILLTMSKTQRRRLAFLAYR